MGASQLWFAPNVIGYVRLASYCIAAAIALVNWHPYPLFKGDVYDVTLMSVPDPDPQRQEW